MGWLGNGLVTCQWRGGYVPLVDTCNGAVRKMELGEMTLLVSRPNAWCLMWSDG